ncbi:hypothetical protein [Xanthomonas arboricola]|uniref:hypothetical protein n=1 Tax=Xanthomonas arboricola TaxID=56448 RepID=UPI000E1EC9B9|nr:hypothetical protein [Xanthomonas arboricola]
MWAYLTQQVVGTSTHRDFKTSNSTSTYDAWGKLLSVRENTLGGKVDDRLRYFTMDAEGNILRRTEGKFESGKFTQDDAERLRTEGALTRIRQAVGRSDDQIIRCATANRAHQ